MLTWNKTLMLLRESKRQIQRNDDNRRIPRKRTGDVELDASNTANSSAQKRVKPI